MHAQTFVCTRCRPFLLSLQWCSFSGIEGELERNQHPGAGLSRYYRVVELAMESNSEDVVEAALGQLHKLVGESARRSTQRYRVHVCFANPDKVVVYVLL